jgi:hypothetical protein
MFILCNLATPIYVIVTHLSQFTFQLLTSFSLAPLARAGGREDESSRALSAAGGTGKNFELGLKGKIQNQKPSWIFPPLLTAKIFTF